MSMGGPWAYYEDFRRAHDLTNLPQAQVPEIAVAAGSTLQLPLILRNDTKTPAEISLAMTLPEGWTQKDPIQRYQLAPGDVFPTHIELVAPAKKDEKGQQSELVCRASVAGSNIGSVSLRVHLGTGGLPQ